MKYLCLIYENEKEWEQMPKDQADAVMGEYFAFTDGIRKTGQYVGGDALHPTQTATTVRVRDGKTLTTDGPFAETKEHLGGFYVLECANLDEAIAWAAKIPNAADGSVEVRPVMEFDEPADSTADDDAAARA